MVFGGKVVVLGGDLCQILPVVEGGGRAQVVDAAIVNSQLWKHVRLLSLTTNLRLSWPDLSQDEQNEIAQFSKWVLDVGEGKIDGVIKDGETGEMLIKVLPDLLLMPQEDKIQCMVNTVYPDLAARFSDPHYLQSRAILTPTNEATDSINSM